jgi:hypothetical protein
VEKTDATSSVGALAGVTPFSVSVTGQDAVTTAIDVSQVARIVLLPPPAAAPPVVVAPAPAASAPPAVAPPPPTEPRASGGSVGQSFVSSDSPGGSSLGFDLGVHALLSDIDATVPGLYAGGRYLRGLSQFPGTAGGTLTAIDLRLHGHYEAIIPSEGDRLDMYGVRALGGVTYARITSTDGELSLSNGWAAHAGAGMQVNVVDGESQYTLVGHVGAGIPIYDSDTGAYSEAQINAVLLALSEDTRGVLLGAGYTF